jgi:hypothetical protein
MPTVCVPLEFEAPLRPNKSNMDTPVFSGQSFLGMMAEEDARLILKKREGRLIRGHGKRKIQLNSEASARTRVLCARDAGVTSLSSTQREELYSGFRKDRSDGPVTAVLTVVRKVRDGALVPWKESDKFPRNRFNPDKATPLFASERIALTRRNGLTERITSEDNKVHRPNDNVFGRP